MLLCVVHNIRTSMPDMSMKKNFMIICSTWQKIQIKNHAAFLTRTGLQNGERNEKHTTHETKSKKVVKLSGWVMLTQWSLADFSTFLSCE